jgi:DNA-binding winged helix-turn-helix (wHTH) protein
MLYSFGPYRLDPRRRRLLRDGQPVPMGDRVFRVLQELVSGAGSVQSKDDLVRCAWDDVAVTDNSLEQAISTIRKALGAVPGGGAYIETVARRGYRFAAEVSRVAARESDEALDALLAPHQAWLEGRAALETLSAVQAARAERAFDRVLELSPDHAPAHVGLANACLFRFESSRADERPDTAALARAVEHAADACRLDSEWSEAWATFGLVLQRTGQAERALAACRRAVSMDPENWRHHLRLGLVGWGEERLQSAGRTLRLLPGLALAHWLAATVHVARQAFDLAERELVSGTASQDEQVSLTARFGAVGLHWLHGLVRFVRGDREGAREAFERELSFERSGHLYARECCANTWYALGALHVHEGNLGAAAGAAEEALKRVPGHAPSLAIQAHAAEHGLALPPRDSAARLGEGPGAGSTVEAVVAAALHHALRGRHREAAALVQDALSKAPPGSAGWTVPVEPLLRAIHHHDAWAGVLSLLRSRAA